MVPAAPPMAATAAAACLPADIPMVLLLKPPSRRDFLIDLPRQYGGELVGEAFHAHAQLAGIR